MVNAEIREIIFKRNLKYWQVAQALQINPCTLSRWLRIELSSERAARVLKAINLISQ